MRIFLSYASEDRAVAEDVAIALQNDGHRVFFDRSQLTGGENYHQTIREEIAEADLLVFLISPDSIQPGSYALTELRITQDRWPSPARRVVPVQFRPTPMETIPAYLRGVTIFEPKGNVAAEIAAHVERKNPRLRRRLRAGVAVGSAAAVVWLAVWLYDRQTAVEPRQSFVSTIAATDFVSEHVLPADVVTRDEYTLDPTTRFPAEPDVVRLERIAFGRLADGSMGFNVRVNVHNPTAEPIQLDLTPRFFTLSDDQGRDAELLYFCCEAEGEILGPRQQRQLQLIYRAVPGWQGKEGGASRIHFHISGLLPLVRGSWSFPPLRTAN